MEHPEECYGQMRYPPRDYCGSGERGHYDGYNAERGRGRGFVSSCYASFISPAVLLSFTY